jgi:hypothetical protein
MPTAEATLLPPPYSPSSPSTRRLDEVGVETVLGAMIEQKRRASQPSYPALTLDLERDGEGEREDDAPATERAPTRSEVFLKAR